MANSSTVSEVEVSESTVVQLKLASTPFFSSACMAPAGSFASVNTKHSIVAMSGAIMPLPLAMPVIRTSASPICAVRVAALGNVSVVMMPRAASSQASSRSLACSAGSAAISFSCGSTSPITPVEAMNTCFAGQPTSFAAAAARRGAGVAPGLAGEHVGIAGIHHDGARLAAGKRARHQSTGAPGHLLEVKTPATVVPARQLHHHEVVAALIANACRRGAQADAARAAAIPAAERRAARRASP